jgi:uncharacterized HhH-GPD family protein
MAAATPSLHLAQDPAADALLSKDPLALLIGMVLDQQIPLEKAFRGPLELRTRLRWRQLTAKKLAALPEDELVAAFVAVPALHRFPADMARRVQALCKALVESHGGRAEDVWTGASDGADLLARIKALPGFGEQKARIFTALLGKQLGVDVPGWREAAGVYGEPGSLRSVADIVDAESLGRVRAWKAEQKRAAKASPAES